MRKGFGIAALAKLGYRPLRRCGGVRKRILRLDRLRLRGLSGARGKGRGPTHRNRAEPEAA